MQTDRITGAALIILGGLLIWWIIPWQAEAVGYGWLRPQLRRGTPFRNGVVTVACYIDHKTHTWHYFHNPRITSKAHPKHFQHIFNTKTRHNQIVPCPFGSIFAVSNYYDSI